MRPKASILRLAKRWTLLSLLAFFVFCAPAVHATPTLRFLLDEHGDFQVFGNSVGQDCRAGIPAPLVGAIGACGANIDDGAPDVLWRSDDATLSASASTAITPANARSSGILKLPTGAVILYARLYWAGQVAAGATPKASVSFERPGVFAKQLAADSVRGTAVVDSGLRYYQSTADVTADLQANGPGVYRVGGIDTVSLNDLNQSVDFVAWSMVVFYRLDADPTRNLALFDGLDRVAGGAPANVNLSGFLVPVAGFDAKLGAITYEGDYDITGDAMIFNGAALSDALNPADNFFNSTRSYLGTAVSNAGDLPQLSGDPGSMGSYDVDVVDVTPHVKAGDTQATIQGTSSGDVYFLGAFITSVATLKPVFSDTNKTFTNLTRVGGSNIPGDIVEYTITTHNTGSDTGTNVVLTDVLPSNMTYVPGSLSITTGDNVGGKTDAAGDDQAEYNSGLRLLTVRLGLGANGLIGGVIKVADPVTTIKFRVKVDAGFTGTLRNQVVVSSQGVQALAAGVTAASSWMSGDGKFPTAPTKFVVDQCASSANCSATAPICDTSIAPAVCMCAMDSDCPAGQLCDVGGSNACVQCTAINQNNCNSTTVGAICLPSNLCGCNVNADCGGRTCNTMTHQCPPNINTDLAVLVVPPAAPTAAGRVALYTVTIVNNGPSAVVSADLSDVIPTGVSGVSWTCSGAAGASCPAGSGTGTIGSGGRVSLPVNGRLTYVVSIPVPGAAAGGVLDYSVTGTLPVGYTDVNPDNNSSTGSATVVPATDLAVAVSSSPQALDGSLTHTLAVVNNGPASVMAESLVYQVPAGTQVESVTPGAGWSCLSISISINCTRTITLAAGSGTPTVMIRVRPPVDASMLTVAAKAQGMDDQLRPLGDILSANNDANLQIPIVGPDLALTVSSGPQAPDGTVTHLLQLENHGPGTAPGERVTYDIPVGYVVKELRPGQGWNCTSSVAASGGGTHISCTRNSSLAPLGLAPPIQVIVQPPLGSTTLPIQSTATGLGDTGQPLSNDPQLANNLVTTATPVLPGPDLALRIEQQPQSSDGSLMYRLQATNYGPGTAPGAAIVFDLPSGTRIKSMSTGQDWTCIAFPLSGGGTELSCTRTVDLAPGDAPPIEVTVVPPYGASALATSGTTLGLDAQKRPLIDPLSANNVASSETAVVTGPDLALTATTDPQAADGSVTIRLQVSNKGEGVAPGATVDYEIPASAIVQRVDAGAEWVCAISSGEAETGVVHCVRHAEITIGNAPEIAVILTPLPSAQALPLHAFTTGVDVQGRMLFDPDLRNNAVTQSTDVAMFRLAGGGAGGCSATRASTATPEAVALVLLWVAIRILRRKREKESTLAALTASTM